MEAATQGAVLVIEDHPFLDVMAQMLKSLWMGLEVISAHTAQFSTTPEPIRRACLRWTSSLVPCLKSGCGSNHHENETSIDQLDFTAGVNAFDQACATNATYRTGAQHGVVSDL